MTDVTNITNIYEILIGAVGITLPLIVGFLVFLWILKSFLIICDPDEIVIISGRKHKTAEGNTQGFKVLTHGRTIRIPIIEQIDRMDATLISVPIHITGAYSLGGIPLSVPAVANIKLSSNPEIVANAVERFLSKNRDEIARVAKETLEGHLRGVLATLTPEEVNEDRLKFAEQLQEEAESDLNKLGIQLDTFKIQHVSDDRDYLDSLGRRKISEIIRSAEIAESDSVKSAEEAEAAAKAKGEVALIEADMAIKAKENELRLVQADCDAAADSANERAVSTAKAVRANEEIELQKIRIELEKLKTQADITIPAQIEQQVLELKAEGKFAHIRENGLANAKSLELMQNAWNACKGNAMDIVVAQRVEKLLEQATLLVADMKIADIALTDSSDGNAIPHLAKSYQACVREVFNEMCQTLGVSKTHLSNPNSIGA